MSHLQKINTLIKAYGLNADRNPENISLLAVTKNRSAEDILPLIMEGHRLFGENRVQEAYSKWPTLKNKFSDIKLHLIGHLQTNKIKEAVALFDVIQTLDSFRLADKLAIQQEKQKKNLQYLIEVNIGKEPQKTGIWPEDVMDFLQRIRAYYPLNIQGIMCIPPMESNPIPYFQLMQTLAKENQLPVISMGMSKDFQYAISCGSTLLRIGRALFEELVIASDYTVPEKRC